MVFVPTHNDPVEPHEASAAPRRPDHAAPPTPGKRLSWRAVVRATKDHTTLTSWHLTACSAPQDPAAHCPAGQQLIEAQQDPDGHCLVDGACGRCEGAPG
jgi:hypothetical protein